VRRVRGGVRAGIRACLAGGLLLLLVVGQSVKAQLEDSTSATAVFTMQVEQAVVLHVLRVVSVENRIDVLGQGSAPVHIGDVFLSTKGICSYLVLASATLDSGRLAPRGFFAEVSGPPETGTTLQRAELGESPVPLFGCAADWPVGTESLVEVFCDVAHATLEPGAHSLEITFAILERE